MISHRLRVERTAISSIPLFENDCFFVRLDSSWRFVRCFGGNHTPMGQYFSAKVDRTLQDEPIVKLPQNICDYKISDKVLEGLSLEVFNGI